MSWRRRKMNEGIQLGKMWMIMQSFVYTTSPYNLTLTFFINLLYISPLEPLCQLPWLIWQRHAAETWYVGFSLFPPPGNISRLSRLTLEGLVLLSPQASYAPDETTFKPIIEFRERKHHAFVWRGVLLLFS